MVALSNVFLAIQLLLGCGVCEQVVDMPQLVISMKSVYFCGTLLVCLTSEKEDGVPKWNSKHGHTGMVESCLKNYAENLCRDE